MSGSTTVYCRLMGLGANIRALRTARGWTLDRLAELSDVDVGTISALENRNSTRSKFAAALARALGVTLEQLLDADLTTEYMTAATGGPALAAEAAPQYHSRPAAESAAMSALLAISALLIELPEEMRHEVRQRMGELVDNPDSQVGLRRLETLLTQGQHHGSRLTQTAGAHRPAPQSTVQTSAEKSPTRGKRRA